MEAVDINMRRDVPAFSDMESAVSKYSAVSLAVICRWKISLEMIALLVDGRCQ